VTPERLAERLRPRFPDVLVARGEVTLFVEADALTATVGALRDDPDVRLDFLSSVTATHHPGRTPEFWVIYELRSVEHAHRLRIKVGLSGEEPTVPSLTPLFPTANWHERETWDLFGVRFDGHPHLVRILLPDDWEGHPLRKDEGLGGVGTWFHGASIPTIDERTGP
jgi:NADH-quinone oxidoreductase subunit C